MTWVWVALAYLAGVLTLPLALYVLIVAKLYAAVHRAGGGDS